MAIASPAAPDPKIPLAENRTKRYTTEAGCCCFCSSLLKSGLLKLKGLGDRSINFI
ncbi:hypothetical protein H6F95_11380 [Cyanobacteria bacterium FACHB-471]|nr:hypothetical protein [Cyanobacteria bacterium FACHB-471]